MFFESIKIMFLGMGTVFLFLTTMVYMTKIMSKLILRYFPEASKTPASASQSIAPTQKINENAKIAAILAALQHHHALEQEGKI
ncbi:OadG family protein [Sulfuricurvum sp.]|uniref:OadG family protein n=1 Tax=Sulfuricurvum sp. TaxID=2025608 RepID=UPI00262FB649|nr:OadG family transporter subunit [Sulfuricurvum sp.]MDD2267322.1 OadG family transporter subunit [Sulfuricurvum sp.]MDD2783944.1 OadG family transporter subunit [Sulfuricurvum sp.]HZF70416.1 OadG family transporter subunit [Sulfuricurvum sp.]